MLAHATITTTLRDRVNSAVIPRLMVSATCKSSGKTLISIGLAAAWARQGLLVHPFKKGPDYIDPRWLEAASGNPCHNLDFHMMGRERVRQNFDRYAVGADLCLIEGNHGLFDGQEMDGSDCGAALAELLQAPVLLVVNCKGIARGVAPLVLGHLRFPGGERIGGIILNNVGSSRQEKKLTAALARYCPAPVLGVLPRSPEVVIDERHLGLEPVGEREELRERIGAIADHVQSHLDLEPLLALARTAPPLPPSAPTPPTTATAGSDDRKTLRVAYAADRAFHFYYPENLQALRDRGVELIPISLLNDTRLPEVDGLYIGGGFPEMFMTPLTENRALMADLRHQAEAGLPVYAECGGLMVLAERIHWQGRSAPMAGALPVEVEMGDRPQGYGYMEIEGTGNGPWPGEGRRLRCHEFHYSRVSRIGDGVAFAYRVRRGYGVDGQHDGLLYRNILASYAHFHVDADDPDGAGNWADFLVNFWGGT